MAYERTHEPSDQHNLTLGANAADIDKVEAVLADLTRRLPNGVVVEVVEAAMAKWLTDVLKPEGGGLLSTTILTDGDVATDTLEHEGLA